MTPAGPRALKALTARTFPGAGIRPPESPRNRRDVRLGAQSLAVEPIGARVIDHDPKHGLPRRWANGKSCESSGCASRAPTASGYQIAARAAVLGLGIADAQRAGQQEQDRQISRPAWASSFPTVVGRVLIITGHRFHYFFTFTCPAARRRWRSFGLPFRGERPAPRT